MWRCGRRWSYKTIHTSVVTAYSTFQSPSSQTARHFRLEVHEERYCAAEIVCKGYENRCRSNRLFQEYWVNSTIHTHEYVFKRINQGINTVLCCPGILAGTQSFALKIRLDRHFPVWFSFQKKTLYKVWIIDNRWSFPISDQKNHWKKSEKLVGD